MSVTNGTLNAVVQLEGRVQAKNRMTVIAEVSGMLPVGGKEFREGVSFQEGEIMLSIDDQELRANLVSQRSQWLQLLASIAGRPAIGLSRTCGCVVGVRLRVERGGAAGAAA